MIELADLRGGYVEVVRKILREGCEVSPRGQRTLEIGPVTLAVADPRLAVPVGVGRRLNLAIGAAESCHLIGGTSDAAMMASITKNFEPFVEGDRLRGAYGPRLHSQWPRVLARLEADQSTRQAGAVVWRARDLAEPTADLPCTVHLQFWVRDRRLHAHVLMRSNDVFWGLPYDAWMFCNAQLAVAGALQLRVGTYYHTAISLHAYVDRDAEALAVLHDWDGTDGPPMLADFISLGNTPAERWERIAILARSACGTPGYEDFATGGTPAKWYQEVLLRHWTLMGVFCPSCRYVLPEDHFVGSRFVSKLCRPCAKRAEAAR